MRTGDQARSLLLAGLASAVRSGREAREALELLSGDDLDPRVARMAGRLATKGAGKSLADSMASLPEVFDPATVELVRDGERSGSLADHLELAAADSTRSADLSPRVALALIFPLIGLTAAVLVLLLLAIFVVPAFRETFASFGADLPSLTLAYLGVADFIAGAWYVLVILAVLLVLAMRWRARYSYGRSIDRLLSSAPFVGSQLQRIHSARTAGLLADVARMNIDARAALTYLRDSAGNRMLAERTAALINEAGATPGMAAWLSQSRSVPRRLSIAAGLQTDPQRLAESLAAAADQYAEAARAAGGRIERNTFIWAYIIVGLIVGSFVIAMYLPIFKIGSM